jgi:membrane protein implicated in regulation of membrane protease activity
MKLSARFKPKFFVAMLAVCAAIAGLVTWATGLNFWILAAVLVGAVLVNGLVASVEERDSSRTQD